MGISLGIGNLKVGSNDEDWLRYWIPPNKSDILAGGDGTILTVGANKYLRSLHDRNFLITGYDFPTDWTKGIPYKSTATISAPAGDAVLIAADVNSFLYTAGTPNQIPVVSLFQDIEYANKIFTKHAAQIVDGNGVETYEPRVLEWAVYSSARTGVDLTACNTYFDVPVELTVGMKWVDGVNGNDTTGTGAKLTPYKTIKKAVTIISAGQIIYVKSGICTEVNGAYNLLLQKACIIQVLGFIQLRGGGDPTNPLIRIDVVGVVNFNGFILDGTGGYDIGIRMDSANKTINRCFIRNVDTHAVSDISNSCILRYCVITEKYIVCKANISTIDTCYFYSANASVIACATASAALQLINNKFKTRTGNILYINLTALTSVLFKGNTFDINVDCTPVYHDAGINATIEYAYNNFIVSANITNNGILFYNATVTGCTFNIHDNIFNVTNIVMATAVISLTDTPTPIIKDNFIFSKAAISSAITIKSEGSTVGVAEISGNHIELEKNAAYGICIGSEATGAGDGKINGALIHDNYLKCACAFGVDPLTVSTHGIFVGFNINAVIKYNRVEGAGYGIPYKGSGTADVTGMRMYNLIINCLQGIRVKGVKAVKIYNNTVISNTINKTTPIYISNNAGVNECDDCIVKNNIIIYLGTSIDQIVYDFGANTDFDYNIYYCPNVAIKFAYQGNYKTWAEWQALGKDTHSLLLTTEQYNALFNDPDNGDYSLKAGCVAIGAGVDLGAAYDDGLDSSTDWGDSDTLPVVVTKQQGASWDIGAYVS